MGELDLKAKMEIEEGNTKFNEATKGFMENPKILHESPTQSKGNLMPSTLSQLVRIN